MLVGYFSLVTSTFRETTRSPNIKTFACRVKLCNANNRYSVRLPQQHSSAYKRFSGAVLLTSVIDDIPKHDMRV